MFMACCMQANGKRETVKDILHFHDFEGESYLGCTYI